MKTTPTNHRNKACEAVERLLGPYLFGELEPVDKEGLEKHLSTCPACVLELADMRRAAAKLQAEMTSEPRLALSEARKRDVLAFPAPLQPGTNRLTITLRHLWHSPVPRAAGQLAAVFIGLTVIAALVVPGLFSVVRRRHPEGFDEKSPPAIVAEPAAETESASAEVAEDASEDAAFEVAAGFAVRHRSLAARQQEMGDVIDADGPLPAFDLSQAEAKMAEPPPARATAPVARPDTAPMPALRRAASEVAGDEVLAARAEVAGKKAEPWDELSAVARSATLRSAPAPSIGPPPALEKGMADEQALDMLQTDQNLSYLTVRENLRQGRLPPPGEVRVEKFVQAFAPAHAPLAEPRQRAGTDGQAVATLDDEALAGQTVEDAPQAFLLAGAAEFANLLQRDEAAPPELFGNLRRLLERVARAQPENARAQDLLDLVRQAEMVSGRQ